MSGVEWFRNLAWACFLLTAMVVVLGAFVRLTHAGLGCPDWPGCYGHIGVPSDAAVREAVAAEYFGGEIPAHRLEVAKGWKEMLHRYLAGILGILVLVLAWIGVALRRNPQVPWRLSVALLGLVIFQATLGMWTVTLLLKPFVVTLHLLGGFSTLALLWWIILRSHSYWRVPASGTGTAPLAVSEPGGSGVPLAGPLAGNETAAETRSGRPIEARLRPWILAALLLVPVQVALGGWTSTNYAALACTDFPTCQGEWWPEMDFSEAFVLWRGLGIDYEGGVLDHPARTAIQVTHRIGAGVVTLVLAPLGLLLLLRGSRPAVRGVGGAILLALTLQLSLGMANVWMHLPLWVATAHNAGGALLLLVMLTAVYITRPVTMAQPAPKFRAGASSVPESESVPASVGGQYA